MCSYTRVINVDIVKGKINEVRVSSIIYHNRFFAEQMNECDITSDLDLVQICL